MAKQFKLLMNVSLIALALVITLAPAVSVIGEEVTLTTIMPGQDTLRVKRGAVGTSYKDSTNYPDATIGDDNLIIEGNVGIGTDNPGAELTVAGTIESTTGGVKFPDGTLQTTAAVGVSTYVSGWKSISAGGNVNFPHPLGTDQLMITVQLKPSSTGTISIAPDSEFVQTGYGACVTQITSTNIRVTGGSGRVEYWTSGGTIIIDNSSYVRVLVMALN